MRRHKQDAVRVHTTRMRRFLALFAALALLLIGFTPPPCAPRSLVVASDAALENDGASPSADPELDEEDWGVSQPVLSLAALRRSGAVVDRESRGADGSRRLLDDPPRS